MSRSPGQLAVSQVIVMPDGSPVEAVLDADANVFARWCSRGELGGRPWWSGWEPVASGAAAIFLAPAAQQSKAAYLTVTGGPGDRTVHLLRRDGLGSGRLGAPCDVPPS